MIIIGGIDVLNFKEFDKVATLIDQLQSEEGVVVLVNTFTVDAADEEALIKAWSKDAQFMKAQPGYISTQLHKGIAGSSTFLNYAVWESVAAFRNAFSKPEFQQYFSEYPDSAVASPHLFKKMPVENLCVG